MSRNSEMKFQHDHSQYYKGYLTGRLLIATPFCQDNRFSKAVIYICGHDSQGAIGLMINKPLESLTFLEFMMQLNIKVRGEKAYHPILYGGPIEVSRGFVIHSSDYCIDSTVTLPNDLAITSTLEVLRSVANGSGPSSYLVALGYASWLSKQLEQEIQNNEWFVSEPTPKLLFNVPFEDRWRSSFRMMGVDPSVVNLDGGHA